MTCSTEPAKWELQETPGKVTGRSAFSGAAEDQSFHTREGLPGWWTCDGVCVLASEAGETVGGGSEDTPTHSQNSRDWDGSAVVSKWGSGGHGLLSRMGGAGSGESLSEDSGPGLGGSWWRLVTDCFCFSLACVCPLCNQLPFKSVTSFYFFKLSGLFLTTLMSVQFPGPAYLALSALHSLAFCGSS